MNAFEWIGGQPWAITPDFLMRMVDVVERHPDIAERRLAEASEESVKEVAEAVSAKGGTRMDGATRVEMRGGVAVVPVRGPISRYMGLFDKVCGGTSVQMLASDIRAAAENPACRAILLDVDSPGGTATGIGELAEQIRETTKVKPVCAYVGGAGCSAAYWLASACSEVVASPTAVLGSIGAVVTIDTKTKPGQVTLVSSQSPLKRADVNTPKGKNHVQAMLDEMAGEFIASVSGMRGTTPAKVVKNYGKGGTMLGRSAVKCGMADALGSFEGCVAALGSGRRASDTGKTTSDEAPSGPNRTGAYMSKGLFAKLFGRVAESNPELLEDILSEEDVEAVVKRPPITSAPAFDAEAERTRMRAELEAEFKADLRTRAVAGFKATAKKWADSLVGTKILPTEAEAYAGVYEILAAADHDAGGTSSHLDWFTVVVGSKDDRGLVSDVIAEDATEAPARLAGFKTLPAGKSQTEKEREDASVHSLLESTQVGRAALAAGK